MATPRVTVDETLTLSRVVVTDTAPRVVVDETGSTSGVQVTAESDVVSVVLSPSAAGVSSVNGITGAVTGIATTSGVASSIAAIDFPVDSVNGQTNTVVLTTSNIAEGSNEYYTTAKANSAFDTRLATKTTDNLTQGSTNKYFANSLARTAISASGSLSYDSGTGVISYTTPSTIASIANHTTDALAEGSTNLYFTNQRAIDAVGGSSITINPSRWNSPYTQNSAIRGFAQWAAGGTTNLTVFNTSGANDLTALTVTGFASHTQPLQKWVASSSTVASISPSGVVTADSLALTTYPTTTNITEGTRLYYTNERADARVAIGIAALVDSAPATLDTLNELAAALGDDPNYATTITTALGTKLATADFTSTANTWLGTKTTANLAENTNLYYTDARVTTRINNTSIDALSDVAITSAAAGQQFYYNGTNWVNSTTVDSANLNRFSRTASGTGSNAVIELSRNRADAARAVDGGPWLGFAYVGTDNTQTTAVQNAIQSRYQTAGNHQLRFIQFAGDYAVPTVMGQVQRGNTFFNTTAGTANLFLSDTVARVGGTTTTITNSANTQTYASLGASSGVINQDTFSIRNNAGTTTYATFASGGTTISGAGLHQLTRTTVGTPGVTESRPSLNIQLSRSDQATPANFDGTSFRYRVNGSNGTAYTVADLSANYETAGDVTWALNLANGDQTGATFSSVNTIQSRVTATTIRAGTASATPGASTVNDVAIFSDAKILNNRPHRSAVTTASIARGTTYTPAAGVNNFIELTLTSGTDPTYIDVDNLTVAGEGGHQAILVYNNSGSAVGNNDLVIRNNGTAINATNDTIANGARVIFTVYCIGNYASCEYMTAA